MRNIKCINHSVLDDSIHDLLKVAAVDGETLDSVLTDAFAEMYSDEPGPILGQLAVILLSKLKLKHLVARELVDSLHSASTHGRDIYDQVDFLARNTRLSVAHRKLVLGIHAH